MASRGFTVLSPGAAYDRYIENYWNFLLGRDPCNPIFRNTFFMRPCYNYRNVHSISPSSVHRQNFCGVTSESCKTSPSRVYSEGTPDTPFLLRGVKEVFIPVLCTLATDDEVGADGETIPQLEILRAENDIVTPRDIGATIQVGSGQKEDIVSNLFEYRRKTASPFILKVSDDSRLADFMEFEVSRATTHDRALSEGYFLVLEFDTPGTYHIEAEGYGVRGYVSLMNYYIQY
jgi:hypothetical protein